MKRIIAALIGLPLALVAIVLAVTNRHDVAVFLDPFEPKNPAFSFELPLFILVFGSVAAGMLIGGGATWLSQGKWRRRARLNQSEARRWQFKSEELARQGSGPEKVALPPAGDRAA